MRIVCGTVMCGDLGAKIHTEPITRKHHQPHIEQYILIYKHQQNRASHPRKVQYFVPLC
jgi:hypothetical protein